MSWDMSLHRGPYFSDAERAFCPCGEELVFQQEFDATKCLKCIQEEENAEEECYQCGMMVKKHQKRKNGFCLYCEDALKEVE